MRLAGECLRLGHPVFALSLNDPGTDVSTEASDDGVENIRLPSVMPWSERVRLADAWLAARGVECVSVQMVCYGFQPKGIVIGLGDRLRVLASRRAAHIMFHELWIGLPTGAPLKQRVIGQVQRHFILDAVRKLAPKVMHTNNPVYEGVLKRLGIKAHVLPLFSNVPIVPPDDDWILCHPSLAKAGLSADTREKFWVFILFGGLHPEWRPQPLLDYLLQAGQIAGKRILLACAGNLGQKGPEIWNRMSREFGGKVSVAYFGEQPPRGVSEILSFADFGISASPWALVGKSGAAAAMLDHGLPVIVSRDDARFGASQTMSVKLGSSRWTRASRGFYWKRIAGLRARGWRRRRRSSFGDLGGESGV